MLIKSITICGGIILKAPVIFNGYGFYMLENGQSSVIGRMSKKEFQKYETLLDELNPLQDLFRTYQIMKSQSDTFFNTPNLEKSNDMSSEDIFRVMEISSTLFILSNRMFIDNCKNLKRRINSESIGRIIEALERQSSEKNMKVLRDYATHASLPMSNAIINKSWKQGDSSFTVETVIELDKRKMVDVKLSKTDNAIINQWEKGVLKISDVMNQASEDVEKMFMEVVQTFMNENIAEYLKKQVLTDKEKWTDQLLPMNVTGITYQNPYQDFKYKKPIIKRKRIDSDALSLFISTIINLENA